MKFFSQTNEAGDRIVIPDIPQPETRHLFKITIEAVSRKKSPKVKTQYIDKEKGKLIDSWSREDGKEYEEVQYFEGEFTYDDRKEEIYTQEKDTLDVADIALYINRSR